jgi:hypothetical protein
VKKIRFVKVDVVGVKRFEISQPLERMEPIFWRVNEGIRSFLSELGWLDMRLLQQIVVIG